MVQNPYYVPKSAPQTELEGCDLRASIFITSLGASVAQVSSVLSSTMIGELRGSSRRDFGAVALALAISSAYTPLFSLCAYNVSDDSVDNYVTHTSYALSSEMVSLLLCFVFSQAIRSFRN